MKKTVTLSKPIIRGEKEIKDIEVLKPNVLALKGLKLALLFELDVDTLSLLIPRTTNPVITKADIAKMEVKDFTELAGAILNTLNPEDDIEEGKSA